MVRHQIVDLGDVGSIPIGVAASSSKGKGTELITRKPGFDTLRRNHGLMR